MNRAASAVFLETLRRGWRTALWWGLGFALLAASQILVLQDSSTLEQMGSLMESLPPFIIDMFGGGDAQYMVTPEGYLSSQFFSLALLIVAIYAVTIGLNVIANEEDRGQLDLLLSLPITRTQVILGKVVAYALLVLLVLLLTYLGLVGSLAITPTFQISGGRVLEAVINLLPGTLVVFCFTLFVSALTGRRSIALSAAAVFVIASYFVDVLANTAPDGFLGTLRAFSFFRYYNGVFTLRDGLNIVNVLVLLVASGLLFAASVWLFNRRDVRV